MRPGVYFGILTILLLDFIGMIILLSRLRNSFAFQLLLITAFVIISILAMFGLYKDKKWGYVLSLILFLTILLNSFYLYQNVSKGFIIFSAMAILSSLGFLIAISGIKTGEGELNYFDYEQKHEKKIAKDVIADDGASIEEPLTRFTPGKYIASRTGLKYHAPKCDWAKKIKKSNIVWLGSKEEAEKRGYKPDYCLTE